MTQFCALFLGVCALLGPQRGAMAQRPSLNAPLDAITHLSCRKLDLKTLHALKLKSRLSSLYTKKSQTLF